MSSMMSGGFRFWKRAMAIFALIACLSASWILPQPADAIVINVNNRRRPWVMIWVGRSRQAIEVVTFNVPGGEVGNGTPVIGTPDVTVIAAARARPSGSRVVHLTADSSQPLSNGSSTVDFSTISWTARDGTIPSGTFNDDLQTLVSFTNSKILQDWHQFSFANNLALEAGTYSGRVTYTISMP